MTVPVLSLDVARRAASRVVDPELPFVSLADLGVLRSVELDGCRVVVTVTPTYLGCPALGVIRADLVSALRSAGFEDVDVRISLSPPWSSDDVTPAGRELLRAAGVSPPGPAPRGPVLLRLDLAPLRPAPLCTLCGAADTVLVSEFSATACRALYRCRACLEPFEHFKEH